MRSKALFGMAFLFSCLVCGQDVVPEMRIYRELGDVKLSLSVYRRIDGAAEGSAPKPAIVFFFGGGWVNGKETQFRPQSIHLAKRGMVAITADYRVANRNHTTPFEAMDDARAAMVWVRAHAAELGIDPKRIAAGGGSAGGQLATFAGTAEPSLTDALILYNPALDTTSAKAFGDRGAEGSQMTRVRKGLPPTLILHGEADRQVPFAESKRFCKLMSAAGNRCEVVGYAGQDHGFFNVKGADTKYNEETTAAMDKFLTSLGWLR